MGRGWKRTEAVSVPRQSLTRQEFHRTWKRGGCNVEQTQLQDREHVQKWATILAANAMRIERLKHLSRETPELPASVELNPFEIQALIIFKRKHKKRTEEVPDTLPTIGKAVLWLAELGGYQGKSSGGPPGSITIGRGLEFIQAGAAMLEALAEQRSSKRKHPRAGKRS
jgi:hypothetical protein